MRAAFKRSALIGVVVAALAGVGSSASSATHPPGAPPVRLWIVQAPMGASSVPRWVAAPLTAPIGPAKGGGAGNALASVSASSAAGAPAATIATVDAGRSFSLLGVGLPCRLTLARRMGADVRVSSDGAHWSAWWTVGLESQASGGFLHRAGAVAPDPLWTGPARWLQYRLRLAGRIVPLSQAFAVGVATPAFCFIASPTYAADAGVSHAARLAPAARGVGVLAAPAIVTRSQWGANEALRRGAPCFAPVKMAFVHHTDNGNSYTQQQAPALVRGIYAYHTQANGWSDIGYNFLIDRYGTVYEGRYGGVTKGVIGAQTLGFNTGSTGISVIGTFQTVAPPAVAVTALEKLLAWKLDVHHVDPLGKATMTCGAGEKFSTGQHVVFDAISGHRDACFTDCPGTKLYKLLPTIRRIVAATGLPKIYGLQVSHSVISPNGDGRSDSATIGFTMSSDVTSWAIDVTNAAGAVVRHFGGSGLAAGVTWDGRDGAGGRLPDGHYLVTANATSPKGIARAAQAAVVIDTVKPVISALTVTPLFSPNGDGQGDTASVSLAISEPSYMLIEVTDGAGRVVRALRSWNWAPAGAVAAVWDGRIAGSGGLVPAPDGRYGISITAQDYAGNQGSASTVTVVDTTLGFRTASNVAFSPNGDGRADTTTIGCRLTRPASVTLTIASGTRVMRTFTLGSRPAGRVTAVWDGRDAAGHAPVSGTYTFTFSAKHGGRIVTLRGSVLIDLVKPTLVVPARATVVTKHAVSVRIVARDSVSTIIHVTAVVTSSTGLVMQRTDWGWIKRDTAVVCSFTPPGSGVYTVTVHAVDRAQNPESSPTSCVITAK